MGTFGSLVRSSIPSTPRRATPSSPQGRQAFDPPPVPWATIVGPCGRSASTASSSRSPRAAWRTSGARRWRWPSRRGEGGRAQAGARRAPGARRLRPHVRGGGPAGLPAHATPTWCRCSSSTGLTAGTTWRWSWCGAATWGGWWSGPARRACASGCHGRCTSCAEAAKALAYVHRVADGGRPLGLVHRDVSPHNLLVSFEGEVKLADFGIARAMGAGRADRARARSRGRSRTWRRSRPAASPSTPAPTSSRWAWCSGSCAPGGGSSRGTPRPPRWPRC